MKETKWTIKSKIDKRNRISLPPGFAMCSGLNNGDSLEVIWGMNFNCVVIVSPSIELHDRMKERIRILVEKDLSKAD